MQRILDLLLNEVKVRVVTREKNWPSQQAKHGRYKAPAGTPARVAYERDRVKSMGLNPDEPTGEYKTYAQYAASRTPDVKRDGALLPAPEARKVLDRQKVIRKGNTDTKKLQAGLKAVGGKPVTKNQAVNIMNRKRADLLRRGAGRRATPGGYTLPVMTSKSVKDLPEGSELHTSMKKDQIHEGLLGAAKRIVRAARRKFQQSGQRKISSLGGQPSKTNLEAGSKALGKLGKNENLSYRDYIDLEQQRAGGSDRRKPVMVRRRGRGARILLTRPRRGGTSR